MVTHILVVGAVLVSIELVLLVLYKVGTATAEKRSALAAAQEARSHPWWLLIYLSYHIPVLAIVSSIRSDDTAPWWLFAPVTVGMYLALYTMLLVAWSIVAAQFP